MRAVPWLLTGLIVVVTATAIGFVLLVGNLF